jgi:hypothetical protein
MVCAICGADLNWKGGLQVIYVCTVCFEQIQAIPQKEYA